MHRIGKVVAAACMAVVMNGVQAEWTGVGNLRNFNVAIESGGNTVRLTHDVMKNPAGCTNASFLELQAGVQGFQEMYSVLLAAKTADRPVDLHVSDIACTASGHPQITQVSYNYTAGGGVIDSLPLATPSLDGLMSAADKAKLDSMGGAYFESAEIAIPSNSSVSVAHGLSEYSRWQAEIICKNAEGGYSVGDRVLMMGWPVSTAGLYSSVWIDATNVGFARNGTTFVIEQKYGGGYHVINSANWRLIFKVWK